MGIDLFLLGAGMVLASTGFVLAVHLAAALTFRLYEWVVKKENSNAE